MTRLVLEAQFKQYAQGFMASITQLLPVLELAFVVQEFSEQGVANIRLDVETNKLPAGLAPRPIATHASGGLLLAGFDSRPIATHAGSSSPVLGSLATVGRHPGSTLELRYVRYGPTYTTARRWGLPDRPYTRDQTPCAGRPVRWTGMGGGGYRARS